MTETSMPKGGFIYVVTTLTWGYAQKGCCNVPTWWDNCLYFGPCKRSMRPKMREGHWVFGVSPASTRPRRIVFVAELNKCMTFKEAYNCFIGLRGPEGPIHVRPVDDGEDRFPRSCYEHILHAMH